MTVALFATEVHDLPADFTTGTYKALLLTDAAAAPAPGTDQYVADISGNEVASTTRPTLASKTAAHDDSAGTTTIDCADLSFGAPAAGETAAWCVIYREVTNDADSPLVMAASISRATDGTTITIAVSSNGLVTFTNDATGCP